MKKTMLLLAAVLFSTSWLLSQEAVGVCGNSMEDQLLYEHRPARRPQDRQDRGRLQPGDVERTARAPNALR